MSVQGGYGATLTIAGTAIAHIMEYEFPEFEKILADVTAHDSTGGYAEYIASGKRQMNSFKVTLLWDAVSGTHGQLVDAYESDSTVAFVAADADSGEDIAFSGHVVKLGRVAKQEEGLTCEVEIQPTGIPTIT